MAHFRFAGVGIAAVMASAFVYLTEPHRPSHAPAHQQAPAYQKKPPASPNSARPSAPGTFKSYRMRVALDSTLRADKQTFHLYAADVPGREGTCTYADGRRWACGLRAYVALLNLIGSAPIRCHPKHSSRAGVVICHKGDIDLSEWMLEHGWARLHAGVTDERYVMAAEAAKAAKAGIWVEKSPPQENTSGQ